MTKISFVTILWFLVHSSLVRAQGIRRVKASKSGDGRGNMDQNEIGFGTPSALINDFKLSGTRKQGKSDKASKNHKGSKSEKVVSSVFRSVVMDFCDALTNCSSSTST
jgi:hypothetical protein